MGTSPAINLWTVDETL